VAAVANCGAADRLVGSVSPRAAVPGSLAGVLCPESLQPPQAPDGGGTATGGRRARPGDGLPPGTATGGRRARPGDGLPPPPRALSAGFVLDGFSLPTVPVWQLPACEGAWAPGELLPLSARPAMAVPPAKGLDEACAWLARRPSPLSRWSLVDNKRNTPRNERGESSGVSKVFPGKRRLKLSRVSKPCIFD
jgi:hypothetical protein